MTLVVAQLTRFFYLKVGFVLEVTEGSSPVHIWTHLAMSAGEHPLASGELGQPGSVHTSDVFQLDKAIAQVASSPRQHLGGRSHSLCYAGSVGEDPPVFL